MKITTEYFEQLTGRSPEDDDLERVNCDRAGEILHYSCGWCDHCNKPVFECGHTYKNDTS